MVKVSSGGAGVVTHRIIEKNPCEMTDEELDAAIERLRGLQRMSRTSDRPRKPRKEKVEITDVDDELLG